MTPAIELANQLKLDYQVHEYEHDKNAESYGLEAAEKLSVPAQRVFKTLVVQDDAKTLYVAVLPVCYQLNLKKMAKAVLVKKVQMAMPTMVERSTGYVLGGVSPLGQKKKLKTIIHHSAEHCSSIFVSGGRRGLEIELPPHQLLEALNASYGDIIQDG